MMKIMTLALLLAFTQVVAAQTNPSADYPDFETIVRVFFKNQRPAESYYFINFQKKKDGYHVVELNAQLQVEKSHLLWSKNLGGFLEIPFREAIPSEVERNTESFLNDHKYDATQADLHAFYGYPGWTLDVIETFEALDELPDTLLYSLARAYSYRCHELTRFDSQSDAAPGGFDLPTGKNSMTDAQLVTYQKYAQKAIDSFYRLYQQNPDFETIVGPIYIKYCNEIMFQYLQLHIYQNVEVAKQILVEDLYDPFILATARNFLRSCPPNAVLATWGDNDTYPLLYVQAVENFRTDVLVANLSLLQLGRYIQHIAEGVYDAPPLPLTLGFDFYNNPDHVVAMITCADSSTHVSELMKVLKNPRLNPLFPPRKYPYIPTYAYHLDLVSDSADLQVSRRITFDFAKSQHYLFIYDLFFLDLIYSTNGNRPICYAASCTNKSMVYLKKYLALNGMVYVMNPNGVEPDDFGLTGGPDAVATEKLLLEEFEYADFPAFTSDVKILSQYYFFAFLRLSKWNLVHGDHERAVEIADRFLQLFPFSKTKSAAVVYFGEIYLSAGQAEKAQAVWLPLVEHWKENPEAQTDDALYFNKLMDLAESNGNQALMAQLEALKQ